MNLQFYILPRTDENSVSNNGHRDFIRKRTEDKEEKQGESNRYCLCDQWTMNQRNFFVYDPPFRFHFLCPI